MKLTWNNENMLVIEIDIKGELLTVGNFKTLVYDELYMIDNHGIWCYV